ncbi:MAG: exodeoxyribonuclease VII large subunit [Gammaproteobacteria bacterium]|jgi:exodeoxyribonuclease VII large subunit|nr:exodeoxyribonuclease VII large subunit [Gammaproteobacteria bacterium]MBP6052703.1 exodeoxyribonuclease VII large subunit [Pseudomonadales bacterium]MBK6585054.1 exodeoxyribonuclease VII large subunit [Gammaproteobacteria bacterium]MBK7168702.1 exodeoxyribonuclease VII large subunit [Gammaproteobacteria bacterium]MBK7520231.1 exodeoxyribonuclease VII large subunit [Gammaproteobacteria bacterium]
MQQDERGRCVFSVGEINMQSKQLLESAFPSVWVEGEISNFSAPSSGHWYFTLKDSHAQVRCAMFRNRNLRAKLRPGNGEHVQLRAGVSLYAARGDYQLIVEELEPAGLGALQRALEALRRKLAAEGLFAAERKRPLPPFPAHLAVVTSASGAALHDILTVLKRRYPPLAITVFAVPVQGAGAAAEIAAAIGRANRLAATLDPPLEVMIVGRGGGSLEDLGAFNEEVVVRAIHASTLPVVAAVGHETDITLADLVADMRAPTPSAAAELVSPDRAKLLAALNATRARLEQLVQRALESRRRQLQWLLPRVRHPGARLREQAQRLDELESRLRIAHRHRLHHAEQRLQRVRAALAAQAPLARLGEHRALLAQLDKRLATAMRQQLRARQEQLGTLAQLLDSVSPLATLQRGYAIVSSESGTLLRSIGAVRQGMRVRARLADGALECTVDAVIPATG